MTFPSLVLFVNNSFIMVVGVGFEPTYATRADLQSAAFNHSATPPINYLFNSISNNTPCKIEALW